MYHMLTYNLLWKILDSLKILAEWLKSSDTNREYEDTYGQITDYYIMDNIFTLFFYKKQDLLCMKSLSLGQCIRAACSGTLTITLTHWNTFKNEGQYTNVQKLKQYLNVFTALFLLQLLKRHFPCVDVEFSQLKCMKNNHNSCHRLDTGEKNSESASYIYVEE